MKRSDRAQDEAAPRALPRLTPSVLLDLAIDQTGLGLPAGVAFPFVVMAFGVSSRLALSVSFIAATVGAGFLVGAANFVTGRGVVGVRIQMLSDRMQAVDELVNASTETPQRTDWDAESLLIPVAPDDMIGSSVGAARPVRARARAAVLPRAGDRRRPADGRRRGAVPGQGRGTQRHRRRIHRAHGRLLRRGVDAGILARPPCAHP